ncbi:MAG: hypothetical protein GY761_13520 [Hyphomicrobiales bacterium]|nr:hypothetical protein [Hyphomicrobiales bacterium]
MGHIRLGTLPQTKKWRQVVDLLDSDAPLEQIAEAAARASERDLDCSSDDPSFQFISKLLVELPLMARSPGFEDELKRLGMDANALGSVSALLSGVSDAIDRNAFEIGRSSDLGELARAALLETLSVQLRDRLPGLFNSEPHEIRSELGKFAGGQRFAQLARGFFARLTYKSLDYYLSRELANHTGVDSRFASDADRVRFEKALYLHTYETSRIVEEFASGWYGKTVWKEDNLTPDAINKFTRYVFKKMRSELGRRRAAA